MRLLIILTQCFLLLFADAQNESTKWFFGQNAGLDFATNPPTAIPGSAMTAGEGCGSIAGNTGNLLFYTNGSTIWNQLHQVMANGTGLLNDISSSQTGLILKKPGNNSLYYVLSKSLGSNPFSSELYYSIVDMSLAAGNGSVVTKNVLLSNSNNEKVSAALHCNGIDYWIIGQKVDAPEFRCFLLTSAGITSTVVSTVGTNTLANQQGYMKVSPTNHKICVAVSGAVNKSFQLFDFDNSTGIVSNLVLIPISAGNPYGCEFSPDGAKLYGTTYAAVLQWDICAGNASAIISSQYTVSTVINGGFALQLAPNGKIYQSNSNLQFLSVINNPNMSGASCNFLLNAISIAPGTCYSGLPSIVVSNIKAPFTYTQALACLTLSFTPAALANPTILNCASNTNSVTGLTWNFGDPASGPLNISNSTAPVHTYPSVGTYTVKLTISHSSCAADTVIQSVVVGNSFSLNISTFSVTCNGLGSASVSIAPANNAPASYSWIPSGNFASMATGLAPGIHTVIVSNSGGACSITKTVNITTPQSIAASISNTLSCSLASVQVTTSGGSGGYTYSWTPGVQTTSVINGIAPGSYSVLISDTLNKCSFTKTISVITLPTASLVVLGKTTVCTGNTTTLSLSGADTYSWSNGTTSSTAIFTVNATSTYTAAGYLNGSPCVSNTVVTLIASKCLSLVESENSQLTLYPNPVQNRCTIVSPKAGSASILDSRGRKIMDITIFEGYNNIDLLSHSEGLYFVVFHHDDGAEILKFQVAH